MTFVSLVLIQFFNAYNCRSDRLSVLRRLFANRWLNVAVAWELLLLVIIVYVPFFQRPFGTFSFTRADWMLTTALAFSIVPVVEAVKWMARHGWFGGTCPTCGTAPILRPTSIFRQAEPRDAAHGSC